MSGSMFLLAACGGDELITIWYTLPLGAVVAKDTYAVVERYIHLSRTAYPTFFLYEASLAITAVSISVMAFVWFQILYWRWRATLHRFDEEYAERKKRELEVAREDLTKERPLLQHPVLPMQHTHRRIIVPSGQDGRF
jgi:hypothetical protein